MMPSPADISLVRENKICPVPRSQETPWVFPACAPVCQHYYKPQVSLFKPLSSYQKYVWYFKVSFIFPLVQALLCLSTPPRGGLALASRLPPEPGPQVGSDTKWKIWSVQMEWQEGGGRSLAATRQTAVTYSSEWQPTDNWTKWAGNTHQAWVSLISPPIQSCQPKPGNRSHLTEMRTGTPLQCWKEAYWTLGRELFLL